MKKRYLFNSKEKSQKSNKVELKKGLKAPSLPAYTWGYIGETKPHQAKPTGLYNQIKVGNVNVFDNTTTFSITLMRETFGSLFYKDKNLDKNKISELIVDYKYVIQDQVNENCSIS